MPSCLAGLATQNLNLEKACRVNLQYEKHICDALSSRQTANYTSEEQAVQQLVAGMAGWKTVLQSALPCLLILFLGAWSDRVGRRKPCMLLPIVGELLTSVSLIICTYFFDELPMEVAGVAEALFPGLTGGWFTMFMGIFSYIADVTTEETRTLRIGVVNLFCSLGIPLGMALSGILLKKIGFYGVFSVSAVMYMIAFCYGYFGIEESNKIKVDKDIKEDERMCSSLRNFFDFNHVTDTFRVAFKKTEGNRRTRVIMLMVVVMVVIGPMHGEIAVMYLFTRYRFNWNEVDFSIFQTYSMVTNLIGTLFSVGVFSHILKIDDALIGVMSTMSKILSGFLYAFAVTKWQIYLAPIIEILNGTSFIAMRSIASKLVPSDELGKVNSLFGVCEAMMPLVYAPIYTSLYAATIYTLPGAFFLLGGFLTAPAVAIFLWMYTVHRKERKQQAEANATRDTSNTTIPNGVDNTAFVNEENTHNKQTATL
ncbi:proton-coupled folate transporter-like [Ctenocephalides felis]|uniref:proton-coupled folate transporter-like n=1 Tax=Ctenocephalides felis TaxID=7515 RepID=UPI000E6E1424|nr:proton-coupled folate transporter-like [Ctenocephalides felis]